ncbi:MAG TPA: DUF167 domain-containing protein [Candidatus Eisenbacteria bacterium]|nr:DUF167 domain-containing protein [Candidatus Eisenbacteria bacterium]
MRVQVHVTPKSRRNAVEAARDAGGARIRVRVTAAPEDGKANDAVVELLAARLGLPRRAVRVAGGATSRVKWIEVDGLEEEELWRRLAREPDR